MLEIVKHKIENGNIIFQLKILLVFFIFFSSSNMLKSQVSDEVFQDDVETYYVLNQGNNSWVHWEVSGGEILSENPTQSDSVVVRWTESGVQKLSVYEESINDCRGETYVLEIEVIPPKGDLEIEIPNAFTPNNDGVNDFFVVKSNQGLDDYELVIINRWGNKLYESHSLSESWDGKYKGKKCSNATYFYILIYSYKDEKHVKKGFVYLLR